jgi:hypothetical protein
MFYLSFFILDSSLPSLAFPPFPLPSDFDLRRPFRPRARCRALTPHSFAVFILDARLFRIRRCAVCRRQASTLDFSLSFPRLSLSLRSVHCIATDSDSIIRRNQTTAAQFLPFRSLAFPGNCVPVLGFVSFSLCVSPSLSPSDPTSAIDTRYSNLCEPVVPLPRHCSPPRQNLAPRLRVDIPAAAGITSHGTRTSPGFINFISFAPLSNSRADSIPAIYG